MLLDTVTVVGVGLIGGSIGMALRQRKLAGRVLGVSRSRDSLGRLLAVGAIDEGFVDIEPAVRDAQLVVVCTPVDDIAGRILDLAPRCRPETIVTDAGSTKAQIVRTVETTMPDGVRFVGSHPLAGSEKRGAEHGDGRLFERRVTVVTRTQRTDPSALQRIGEFWQALGSSVRIMSPEDHDRALALTSHLPHLLAAALAGMLPDELSELAATGFRDTTRIAGGATSIWTPILQQNRAAVLDCLARLRQRLDQFGQALETEDAPQLDALLSAAKRNRDALGT